MIYERVIKISKEEAGQIIVKQNKVKRYINTIVVILIGQILQ
jgi:hypothetical protein